MFDGAAVATGAAVAADPAHHANPASDPILQAIADHVLPADPTANVSAPVQVRAADPSQTGGKKEVAFVDASVSDYQTLAAGARAGIEVEVIDGAQNGLAQMALWAETHSGYDAIHVLSHGGEGALNLGTDTVTNATLSDTAVKTELAEIGSALNAEGDLLVYGCDIALGTDGLGFIAGLASATGADVAASTDTTGSAALGGNWTLEARVGTIETSPLSIDGYQELLPSLFDAQVPYATGSNPVSVALYDLNGDSKLDLIVTNAGSNTVSVLLGNGDGTFQSKVDYAVGGGPETFAVGDLNHDGKLDLAVANSGSASVSVLLNNGDGTFGAKTDYGVGSNPMAVVIGDLSGDGNPDLAVANRNSNTVSVLLGSGTGTFGAAVDTVVGSGPTRLAIADLNGDGKLDLVVPNQSDNTVSVLLGNGGGAFTSQVTYATGATPFALAIADLNGDTKLDLVVANEGASTVSVLLGSGGGTFASQVTYTTGANAIAVAIADVNADGKLDLAVACLGSNMASVLLGNGDGTFGSQVGYATGAIPVSVAIGDLNGDGKPDLVLANKISDTVSVLIRSAPPPNAAPTDISLTASAVSIFDATNATIGTLSAVDSDNTAWTFSIVSVNNPSNSDVTGSDLFSIADTTAVATTTLRATGPSSLTAGTYTIRVQADDGAGGTYQKDLTVTVSNSLTVSVNNDDAWNGTDTVAEAASDGGGLSLREALHFASGGAVVAFAGSYSITLGTDVGVAAGVTLDGNASGGADTVTIGGSGKLQLGSGLTLSSGSGDTLTIGAVIANGGGTGAVTAAGGGTVVLSGVNTFTGAVAVNGGTLSIAADSGLGFGTATVTLAAGTTLQVTGTDTINNTFTLGGDATVDVGNALTATFSGIIGGGAFGLTKTGAGTLTLTGNNTFTGATGVSVGTLALNRSGGALADSSPVTISSGATLSLAYNETIGPLAGAGTVSLASGTKLTVQEINATSTIFSGKITGSGSFEVAGAGTGSLTLDGTQSDYTGETRLTSGGKLSVSGGSAISDASTVRINNGTLTLLANEQIAGLVSTNDPAPSARVALGTYSLTVSGSVDTVFPGVISGTGNLVKSGTGTLTLKGVNTYTGTTTVSGGSVILAPDATPTAAVLNGSGAGTVTVASGGTLGGTGTVNSAVSVQSGGTLSPGDTGNNPGTLTVNGNLTIAAGGTLAIDVGGATAGSGYDQVAVTTGSVDVSGATLTTTTTYTPGNSDTFRIIDKQSVGAITGTFNGIAQGGQVSGTGRNHTVSYIGGTGNDAVLTPLFGPAVTAANISVSGHSGLNNSYKIGDAVTATWNNSAGGDNNSGVTAVTFDLTAFGGGAAVTGTNVAGTWSATYTITAGAIDATNRNVSVTATNSNGTLSTTGTNNVIVDDKAPTVTDARISISGAGGTGGAYMIGDTITATWNNTAGGDNESDTLSSVTVDFSQFGGGAAVAATNSAGTWTATYTIVAGSTDGTGKNVSVTVTDNAGNATTTADTTGATLDTVAPTVTAPKISISGASGTGGAFKVGDTVTATWNNGAAGDNNADTISGVSMNFTQFGGGAVVAATLSGGTWTATYTIVDGAIDTTSRNVSVTATDNAGNTTTTAGTANAIVDNIKPTVTDARISIAGHSGLANAYKIGDTVTVTWNNTGAGDNNSDTLSSVTADFSQFGGGSAVALTNGAGTWTASYTIAAGSIDTTDRNVSVTVTDDAGNVTTTADSANATVDTIAPTATASRVSISGASGAGGIYKIGDTVTARWNNIAAGDNNSDALNGVTFDFSQFGGGSAVAATNSSGTWAATYTIVAGSIDATSRNVSATVTDNAGNATTATGNTNATVDNVAPTVTAAKISLSGARGLGGAYKIGDTVTATWNNGSSGDANSDAISTVIFDLSQFGGGSAVTATNSGGMWTASYTITAGSIDATSRNVTATVTDDIGNTTTLSGTSNATVDNQAPTVTAGKIGFSGGTGTGGVFKIGDTVTATWDNSSWGDGNADTLSSVTVDLSQFGGGTAVAATQHGSSWSATYVVAAGSIDASGRTATVTVIDNAGNSTTRTGSATATLDAVAPTVTAGKITLSGVSGLGGAYKIGDTVTASWNNSSGGDNNSHTIGTVTFDLSQFGGGSAVVGRQDGGVWSASYTITAGSTDAVNRNVLVTATDTAGNSSVTTGTTNATVDSIAPKLSSGGISLSGATGADGGIFKIGDVVTATWNSSSSGDNDPDTMSSVKVDFSQFGGGTAVSASNSNGIWTARYILAAGSIDTSSRLNVTVTATDNAGNVTTRSGTDNARADTQRPDAPGAPSLSSKSDTGVSDSDGITGNTTPTFTGSAEPKSTVTIYDTDGRAVLGTTTANSNGDWTFSPPSDLSAGSHTIRMTATDTAGNVSKMSTGTTVIIETRAPSVSDPGLKASPGADGGTAVGVVSGTDPGGQALRYQLTDDYGGHFAIDQTTGKVTIANPIDVDTAAKSFQITVRVTDAAGLYTDKVLTVQKGTYTPPATKVAQATVTVVPVTTTQITTAPATTVASTTVTSSAANNGGANGLANTPTISVGSVGSTDTGAGNSSSRLITTTSMNGGNTDTGTGNSGGRLITTFNMNSPSSGSSISNASSSGPGGGGLNNGATSFSEAVAGGGFGSSSGGFSSGTAGFSSSGIGSTAGSSPSGGSSTTVGTGSSSNSGTNSVNRGTTGESPALSRNGTTGNGVRAPGEPGTQLPLARTPEGAPHQGTPQTGGQQGQGERAQPGKQGPDQRQPQPEDSGPQGQRDGQGGQQAPTEQQPHAYLFGPAYRSFSDQLADAAGKFDRGRDALIEAAKSAARLIDRDAA